MKKIISGCLFLLLCCSSVQATEIVTKTLELGQYAIQRGIGSGGWGQFIAHDRECATIRTFEHGSYSGVVVRVNKHIPADIYLNGRIVSVRYGGDSVVHISYQNEK
ncbi:MAG: hypothetical protein ACKUBY_04235 [Candidatus Moraniibacteriota bacterium]|jgi:hypothetical protein